VNREQEKEEEVTEEIDTGNERDGIAATKTKTKEQGLEKVQSKKASIRDASSIPDGGLWAWLQVLGAFFLFFNSWYVLIRLILLFTCCGFSFSINGI
jgi:hypothetical protein